MTEQDVFELLVSHYKQTGKIIRPTKLTNLFPKADPRTIVQAIYRFDAYLEERRKTLCEARIQEEQEIEITIGTKIVPFDETCYEWQKAKQKGQPYLVVVAVLHRKPDVVYGVTAEETSRIGIGVNWMTAGKFKLYTPYTDEDWIQLFEESNKLRLLMKIDQALDIRDEAAFLKLTAELNGAKVICSLCGREKQHPADICECDLPF